jgi:hypothetical protein
MKRHLHRPGCDCTANLSRRGMFGLSLGAAAFAAAGPALATDKGYEAMLMKCIDPRFTTDTWKYMTGRGWQNLYSQFNIAGGPIAAVAPAFADWRKTWWDNLNISVGLHEVTGVVGIVHRDCGAAAVAYGDRMKTDKAFETEKLTEALRAFRDEVKKHQPQLAAELGIMDLDGTVEVVT